jgi:hypothetical protein
LSGSWHWRLSLQAKKEVDDASGTQHALAADEATNITDHTHTVQEYLHIHITATRLAAHDLITTQVFCYTHALICEILRFI